MPDQRRGVDFGTILITAAQRQNELTDHRQEHPRVGRLPLSRIGRIVVHDAFPYGPRGKSRFRVGVFLELDTVVGRH